MSIIAFTIFSPCFDVKCLIFPLYKVTMKTSGKYITRDLQKIKAKAFPDYFNKIIILTGSIQQVIAIEFF